MARLSSTTREATNFARVSRLLVDGGTLTLRKVFDGIHPPNTLQAVLMSHLPLMLKLKRRKILTDLQWDLLFPASPAHVDSSTFDITLLVVLLRNICSLPAPVKGWDELPLVTETNKQDDIARIKFYRNEVYAHASKASLLDVDFANIWAKAVDALLRLGANAADINELKNASMDPEANLRCMKSLKQWYLHGKRSLEEAEESLALLREESNVQVATIRDMQKKIDRQHAENMHTRLSVLKLQGKSIRRS